MTKNKFLASTALVIGSAILMDIFKNPLAYYLIGFFEGMLAAQLIP